MTHASSSIKLLTGNSHPELAETVAEKMGLPLCKCTVKKFSDNETSVSIGESVRDADVFIIQTGYNPLPIDPKSQSPSSSSKSKNNNTTSSPSLPSSSSETTTLTSNSSSLPPSSSSTEVKVNGVEQPLPPSYSSTAIPHSPHYTPNADPNDLIMELLILINACKTASARRITAVIPCFPYARMDRKERSRAPITARLLANMLQVAGCDHVITLDLHASQIQGFFDIPVDNLWTEPIMVQYIKTEIEGWRHSVIVSPDAGGAKRATQLADRLGVNLALINQNRKKATTTSTPDKMDVLVGDVKDKVAILLDDMADTANTLELAVQTLSNAGAKKIYALVSHGLLSGDATKRISKLPIERVTVTDSVCQRGNIKNSNGKLDTMKVGPLIAESIRRTHNGESISLLFETGGAATF